MRQRLNMTNALNNVAYQKLNKNVKEIISNVCQIITEVADNVSMLISSSYVVFIDVFDIKRIVLNFIIKIKLL